MTSSSSPFQRIVKRLGFSATSSCRQIEHGTPLRRGFAVLKVMSPDVAESVSAAQFLDRLRELARVNGSELARIFEIGNDPETGAPFVVRELAAGKDLERYRRGNALPIDEACAIGLGILAGLSTLHRAGLCHGNLKPTNIFVAKRDEHLDVMLTDPGWQASELVFEPGHEAMSSELSHCQYASPEAVLGDTPTPQSDLFSVGVILYEMLAGAPLLESAEGRDAFRAVVTGKIEPLAMRNPGVPEPLARAVESCLAADPADRMPSVSALARQLSPYVADDSNSELSEQLTELTRVHSDAPTPSLQLRRAPKPRRDEACPEQMLMEPAFPRLAPSALLHALHEDVESCPKTETEGYESSPAPAPASNDGEDDEGATHALENGRGVGNFLAWLRAIM